jgi:hypothetical protein
MRNKTLAEDKLDGSSNFSSWKSRLQITLEEDDLLSVIQKTLLKISTDEEKEERKEDDVKTRKLLHYYTSAMKTISDGCKENLSQW